MSHIIVVKTIVLRSRRVLCSCSYCQYAPQVLLLTDVKMPSNAPQLSLLVKDACEPGPAADVLTVISWTLPQFLTALCIGPLAAPHPNDVLVTLATLTNLQSLQLQVRRGLSVLQAPLRGCNGIAASLPAHSACACRPVLCKHILTDSVWC